MFASLWKRVIDPFRQSHCPGCGSTVRETFCEVCGYDLIQKTRDDAHFPHPGPR
jgi:hypothetical protein